MITLRKNDPSPSVTIETGLALTVKAPPGSSAYVSDLIDFSPSGSVDGTTTVFGPYETPQTVTIVCTNGAVFWEIGKPVVNYVTVKTNPVTGVIELSSGEKRVPVGGARTTTLRVATFGDSTANAGVFTAPTDTQTTEVAYAPFPASGATQLGSVGGKWGLPWRYPKAALVFNGGVSGETTTQMLARDAAAYSVGRRAVTDLINSYPDVVILRAGSINDLTGVTAGTLNSIVAATYANHIALIQRIKASGALILDEGVAGYSGVGATDPAVTRQAIVALNALYAAYAATDPDVEFVSPVGVLSDATGLYMTGASYDGTHLSSWGQYSIALEEAKVIYSVFGPSVGNRFSGTNLITNALMAATGSQAYGTVATGYAITAAAATRQNAKIEVIDGKIYQTCEFVPSGASNSGTITIPFDPTTLGIVANDVFGGECDFLLQTLDGSNLPLSVGISFRLQIYKTGNGRLVFDPISPNGHTVGGGSTFKGHAVFGPMKIDEPSANLTTSSSFYFTFNTDALVPYKLGVSSPRFCKI